MCRGKLALLACLSFVGAAGGQEEASAFSYEKTFGTMYLHQTNPRYGPAGKMYYGPCASAMGLSWLVHHGYPNLLPKGTSEVDSLQAMTEILASDDYMKTDATGTPPVALLAGLQRYVKEAGYEMTDLVFTGWRRLPRQSPARQTSLTPDYDLLRKAIQDPHAFALLSVGYYSPGVHPGEWHRTFGHWVTAVGYGTIGDGKADESVLLIHNPGYGRPKLLPPRTELADRLAVDVVRLSPVQGTLFNKAGKAVGNAFGFYSIAGPGLRERKDGELNIVDGIVAARL